MKKITSITLLSSTHGTADPILSQLKELFQDLVIFRKVIFTEGIPQKSVTDELVVITDKAIEKDAMPYVKPGAQVIVADCVVSIDTIGLLYDIPDRTKVLLANTNVETTTEALRQVTERGIRHLDFFPYYPGIVSYHRECTHVVVFGERQLVPEEGYQVIDLGTRPFDVTTCIKIAIQAGVYDEIKEAISLAFMKSGIQLSYSYARQYRRNRALTDNLQKILDKMQSGVVLLDENKRIVLHNAKAQKLLKIAEGTSPYLTELLRQAEHEAGRFFWVSDGLSYHLEFTASPGEQAESMLLFISDVENIQRIEKDYRTMLLKDGLVAQYTFDDIITRSDTMQRMLQKSRQFAKSNSNVAIYGESGCGKELVAQAIHNASLRRKEAFVAVNFAALSSTLSEAELFGYEDGAFTGAKKGGKKGLFELAHKGTIFLDEIGDCSLEIQKKILRVIQERKVMPIGGSRLIPIDIRIITATNQDLYQLVKKKEFREDLYYRLTVLPLKVPSLRQRKEDVLLLFSYFLKDVFHARLEHMSPLTQEKLLNHPWRGNVRELRNVAEYAANCIQSQVNWEEEVDEILQVRQEAGENGKEEEIASGQTVSLPDFVQLAEELERAGGEWHVIRRLLGAMAEEERKWNRKALTEKLASAGIGESQVKRHLTMLKEKDLIQSRTGAGSSLRRKGWEFLRYLERC